MLQRGCGRGEVLQRMEGGNRNLRRRVLPLLPAIIFVGLVGAFFLGVAEMLKK